MAFDDNGVDRSSPWGNYTVPLYNKDSRETD